MDLSVIALDALSVHVSMGLPRHPADAPAPPAGSRSIDGAGCATPASSSDMPRIGMPALIASTVPCSSPAEDADSAAGPFCLPVLATTGAVNGLSRLCSDVLRSPCTTMCAMHETAFALVAHEQSANSVHLNTPHSFMASL